MSHSATTSSYLPVIFEALNEFIVLLKTDQWLLSGSEEEIQTVFTQAKSVENVFNEIEAKGMSREFENAVCEWLSCRHRQSTLKQLKEACNILLEKALTKPGLDLSRVLYVVEAFHRLCGEKRLEEILSSVIFRCEIYRVIFDYVACSDNLKTDASILFQTHVALKLWKKEKDQHHLKDIVFKWLCNEENDANIAVALFVAVESVKMEPWSSIQYAVESSLVTILKERQSPAVRFWTTLKEVPKTTAALEIFPELLQAALDFLFISGKWMEAQENFEWKSIEKGPCGVAGFKGLVSSFQCLLQCNGIVGQHAREFLFEKQNSRGCTLWDDVHLALS